MKTKTKLLAALLVSASIANAAVTISGTALINTTGLATGDTSIFVVSLDGSSIEAGDFSITQGADLLADATYGPNFKVISSTAATEFFGTISVATTANVTLEGGIDTDDPFAILTFSGNSTTTAAVGAFSVWSDATWNMPIDGITETFTAELTQLDSVAAGSSGLVTAVPEPSTFAALAGFLALGCVALRRRK